MLGALAAPPPCLDDVGGCLGRAITASATGDTERALELYTQLCRPSALHLCPQVVRLGGPIPQAALDVARERCTRGADGLSCNELGRFYSSGALPVGLQDEVGAVDWYQRACDLEYAWGCTNAAWWLARGPQHVPWDAERAAALYRRGCDRLGHWLSCRRLAELEMLGVGTEIDPHAAIGRLRRACDREDGEAACREAARHLEAGRGIQPDLQEAHKLYARACSLGQDGACEDLGALTARGVGDSQATSQMLLERCGSSVRACVGLTAMAELSGLSVALLYDKAQSLQPEWAAKACEQGQPRACERAAADAASKGNDGLAEQLRWHAKPRIDASWRRALPDAKGELWVPAADGAQACVQSAMRRLTDPGLRSRGSDDDSVDVTPLVAELLAEAGLAAQRHPVAHGGISTINVVASLPGRGALAAETVIVGAHHDALGVSDRGALYEGADDNASGVAAMVCAVAAIRERLADAADHRTVLFIGFGAEERGLVGSRGYVADPIRPLEQTSVVINLDMVGRLEGDPLLTRMVPSSLGQVIVDGATAVGVGVMEGGYLSNSDQAPFIRNRVPAMHFFTGTHGDYHQPTDRIERIDMHGLAKVTRLTAGVAAHHAVGPLLPRIQGQPCLASRDGVGWKTWEAPPLKVLCVRPGGAGDALGLRADDVVYSRRLRVPATDVLWSAKVRREGACYQLRTGHEPEPIPCPPDTPEP